MPGQRFKEVELPVLRQQMDYRSLFYSVLQVIYVFRLPQEMEVHQKVQELNFLYFFSILNLVKNSEEGKELFYDYHP